MRKTSVYLTDDEAERLRLLASTTGRSQADLIREGLQRLFARGSKRKFHSLGKGSGDGKRRRGWSSDEVYREATGRH